MSGTQIILMSTAVGEVVDWLQAKLDEGWTLTCRSDKRKTSVTFQHPTYPGKDIVYDAASFAHAIFRLVHHGDEAIRMAQTVEPVPPPLRTSLDYGLQDDLGFKLSVRVWNRLADVRIETLRDLICKRPNELMLYKGIGRRAVEDIQENLAAMGLRLGYDSQELKRLERHVDELETSVRLSNVLHSLGCQYVVDMLGLTPSRIMTKGGKRSVREAEALLAELGFHLRKEEES